MKPDEIRWNLSAGDKKARKEHIDDNINSGNSYRGGGERERER